PWTRSRPRRRRPAAPTRRSPPRHRRGSQGQLVAWVRAARGAWCADAPPVRPPEAVRLRGPYAARLARRSDFRLVVSFALERPYASSHIQQTRQYVQNPSEDRLLCGLAAPAWAETPHEL